MKTIAIVGAGFSGTALAIQLLRQRNERIRVLRFEQRSEFARRINYGGTNPRHLLNVRAGRMSAFSDKPNHFVDWMAERYWDRADPNGFASRHNAPGIGCDVTKSKTPPLRHLVARGLVVSDDAGPITRSRYWEIMAVPDIRLQIEQLVGRLLAFPEPISHDKIAPKVSIGPSADLVDYRARSRHASH